MYYTHLLRVVRESTAASAPTTATYKRGKVAFAKTLSNSRIA